MVPPSAVRLEQPDRATKKGWGEKRGRREDGTATIFVVYAEVVEFQQTVSAC